VAAPALRGHMSEKATSRECREILQRLAAVVDTLILSISDE
jgi:hypothetical protein